MFNKNVCFLDCTCRGGSCPFQTKFWLKKGIECRHASFLHVPSLPSEQSTHSLKQPPVGILVVPFRRGKQGAEAAADPLKKSHGQDSSNHSHDQHPNKDNLFGFTSPGHSSCILQETNRSFDMGQDTLVSEVYTWLKGGMAPTAHKLPQEIKKDFHKTVEFTCSKKPTETCMWIPSVKDTQEPMFTSKWQKAPQDLLTTQNWNQGSLFVLTTILFPANSLQNQCHASTVPFPPFRCLRPEWIPSFGCPADFTQKEGAWSPLADMLDF